MRSSYLTRTARALALALAAWAGCSTIEPDLGREGVVSALGERGLELPPVDNASVPTFEQPLTRPDVLRIALARNPDLRAAFTRLGFAAAEMHDAARLSNPVLSASLMVPDEGHAADEVGFGLAQNFTELLLLPARRRFAEGQFARVQHLVGATVLEFAADVDAAGIRLLAAERDFELHAAIAETAEASAALAERFFAAGNISRLELARERTEAAGTVLARIEAEAGRDAARTALNRLMGLDATGISWTLADELQQPEPVEIPLAESLVQAARTRLDLAAARREVELRADAAGVTRDTRLLGDIELGVETERESDRQRKTGPSVSLELPLFNQGQGRLATAEAELALAQAELAALELDVGSAVRQAHDEVRFAQARAEQYRRRLVPLHEQVVRLTQERLNFMLAGQFEALLVRQQEFAAYAGYLEAVRDYWLARVELARATGTTLQPSKTPPLDGPTLPADEPQPSHSHSGHTGHGEPATTAPDHPQHEGHAMPPETAAPDRTQHDGHAMPPKPVEPNHSNHGQHKAPAAEPAPPPPDHEHSHPGGGT